MIKGSLNPYFGQTFEIETTVPGPGVLTIECWDWDRVGKDDLIGTTSVDIEVLSPRTLSLLY